jgi:hypothetical protein
VRKKDKEMELQFTVTGKVTQTGWGGDLLCRVDLKRADVEELGRQHVYVPVNSPLAGLAAGDPVIVTIKDQLPGIKDKRKH